jgi:MFS transporter, DHA1 family, multidrug resistance protein
VAGSVLCLFAPNMPTLLIGRIIQAAGATAPSVLSRAIARDLFEGVELARLLAFITIAIAAAPGFSPLMGGLLEQYFGWRAGFVLISVFAAALAVAYKAVCTETFRKPDASLDPLAVLTEYKELLTERRFIVPAGSLGLLIGALFAFFAASAAIWIDEAHLTPIELGVLFAGTVFIVFGAGLLAAGLVKINRPVELISGGLVIAYFGGLGFLTSSYFVPASITSLIIPFSLFAAGMGFVNPMLAAIALSPFGDRAGAASSLLGFLQMLVGALGSIVALSIAGSAAVGTGLVLTFACGLAGLIFMSDALRNRVG